MKKKCTKLTVPKGSCGLLKDMQTHPHPLKSGGLKVVMEGAECSEQNGKNNTKIVQFLFFRVIEDWGDSFTKMTLK